MAMIMYQRPTDILKVGLEKNEPAQRKNSVTFEYTSFYKRTYKCTSPVLLWVKLTHFNL